MDEKAELERRLARAEELLRLGAQDLRNPLHVIGMICHLVEARSARGEVLDASTLDRLRRQVERMNRLVMQLVDAGRIAEGSFSIHTGSGDVRALVDRALAEVPPRRRPDLVLALVDTAPVSADDHGRLDEVVRQLIDNAVRFTDVGTPIRITLAREGGDFVLEVRDEGPGIAEADRPLLFTREARVDRQHRPEGLRLGLHVAHHVAALHGGSLSHTPGHPGTTFTLRLPLR